MAKLTPVLDYNNTKNKGKVKGYKVALKKTGVEEIAKMKDSEVDIIYEENRIVIEKKK